MAADNTRRNRYRWVGRLSAACVLTASSVGRADVPDSTLGVLQGCEVIVETESGNVFGGKLIDVRPTSVTLVLPSGDSVTIERRSLRAARAATGESLPVYPPAEPPPPPRELSPGVLEWREGDQIPVGYRKKTVPRTGLIVAGAVVFGTAWVVSAVTAGGLGYPPLAIPVAGPWITAAPYFRGSESGAFGALFVLDGIQQAVGLTLLIVGVATPKTVLVLGSAQPSKTWWTAVPMSFGNGSVGLGIVGTM